MGEFLTDLEIRCLDLPISKKPFQLLTDFIYRDDVLGLIRVPSLYRTDFASVPRMFWRLVPPWGRYGRATVPHDFACKPTDDFGKRIPHFCSSVEAHKMFLRAMTDLKVPRLVRESLYICVRWFGPRFKAGSF